MHSGTRFVWYQKLGQNRTCSVASKFPLWDSDTCNLDGELRSCVMGLRKINHRTQIPAYGPSTTLRATELTKSARCDGSKSSGNFLPLILQIFVRSSVTSSYRPFTASHLGDSGITSLHAQNNVVDNHLFLPDKCNKSKLISSIYISCREKFGNTCTTWFLCMFISTERSALYCSIVCVCHLIIKDYLLTYILT